MNQAVLLDRTTAFFPVVPLPKIGVATSEDVLSLKSLLSLALRVATAGFTRPFKPISGFRYRNGNSRFGLTIAINDSQKLTGETELKRHPHIEETEIEEKQEVIQTYTAPDYQQRITAITQATEPELKEVGIQIDLVEGQPLTSSKNVAEVFGKQHFNVLQSIENLDCSDDFRRLNFQATSYDDSCGRPQKMFLMTQDGWAYLVMGFTGPKAVKTLSVRLVLP